VTDLAIITAILYAARFQRRVPESVQEKLRTIAECIEDATLIVQMVDDDVRTTLAEAKAEPEQPPPSPGTIGRRPEAEAKATRRRG
jgi:hypothetical protein